MHYKTLLLGTGIFFILWILTCILLLIIAEKFVRNKVLYKEFRIYRGMSLFVTSLGMGLLWMMCVTVWYYKDNSNLHKITAV